MRRHCLYVFNVMFSTLARAKTKILRNGNNPYKKFVRVRVLSVAGGVGFAPHTQWRNLPQFPIFLSIVTFYAR